MEIDREKFDEIVLALLFHNSWKEKIGPVTVFQSWKSLGRDALDRLSEKDLISNPKGKAKSVVLTDEGYELARELFGKHFSKHTNPKSQAEPGDE
ncbi:MAG TPA: DUF6429 family protein [Pyrinomonadaceae bacterium]|jgi:hypothetical protein